MRHPAGIWKEAFLLVRQHCRGKGSAGWAVSRPVSQPAGCALWVPALASRGAGGSGRCGRAPLGTAHQLPLLWTGLASSDLHKRGKKPVISSSALASINPATWEILICSSDWVSCGLVPCAGGSLFLKLYYHALVCVLPAVPRVWTPSPTGTIGTSTV